MALELNRGPTRAGSAGSETESKASYKTTELLVYLVVFAGILIASKTISADGGRHDWLRADQAWLYITVLTTVYMVSRGLAKSGNREPGVLRNEGTEAAVAAPRTEDEGEDQAEPSGPGAASAVASPREGPTREEQQPLLSTPARRPDVSEAPPGRRGAEAGLSRPATQTLELPPEDGDRERDPGAPDRRDYETGETNLANVALALGGAGLVSLVFTFGALFFLALPLGLGAMVLARLASRRSERLPGAPGSGRARLAWILGLIASLLSALVLALVVLGVAIVERLI